MSPSILINPTAVYTALVVLNILPATMPSFQDLETENPPSVKVLVIGASYGGLAAALNLLDLCSGRPARFKPADDALDLKAPLPIPIEIKLVDERDGYCENNIYAFQTLKQD